MALYAFDGTWNSDEGDEEQDTNVVRFKELYAGNNAEYKEGVGTRFGALGRVFGGLFGAGGKTRIDEMYDELCENWEKGDEDIDIIGFSRGAALAVHFANLIGDKGIRLSNGTKETVKVRFLGVWDVVGSFGLSFDTFINFQDINMGWDINTVHNCVDKCFHAMALDERRETFNVNRLDPENKFDNIREIWFRGVHSDIGGGTETNQKRSNIALQWMLEQARECGLKINETKAKLPRYKETDRFYPISENKDVKIDSRRTIFPEDEIHPSANALDLGIGESHQCEVIAELKYNWAGVRLIEGRTYEFLVSTDDKWTDGGVEPCGPEGWESKDLSWLKESIVKNLEGRRRLKNANWFALIGALEDEDDSLFLIGANSASFTAPRDADLYMFANDLNSKYGNNKGSLIVTVKRIN